MYDPPGYLWMITIAGVIAIADMTCVVLFGGAERAGLGRRRAALLAGGGRHVRRMVHRQRGDRGSRLVPTAAQPGTVDAGRGGRLPGRAAAVRPAHHVRVRAGTGSATSRRPAAAAE
jgi:hypothetical protein